MTRPDPAVPRGPARRDDGGSVVARIALGAQLRRLRETAGLSREEAAYQLRASAPKISRMELGRVRVKERDVVDLLALYGVRDEAETAGFLALARRAHADGWWQHDRDLLPAWFETYLGMEQAARLIRVFEAHFVPVLLQTEEYARAALGPGGGDAAEVERRVALRLRRQQVLDGPAPPRVWVVLDEAVLHRRVGRPEVMRRQLDHLLDLADRPGVTLQVAALDRPSHHWTGGPFTVLRFDAVDLPDVVYLEHLNGAVYLDKPVEVEDYRDLWNRLCVAVESPPRSAELIRRRRDALA